MSCCCCGPRGRRGLETETVEQQRLVQPPKSESSSLFEVPGRVLCTTTPPAPDVERCARVVSASGAAPAPELQRREEEEREAFPALTLPASQVWGGDMTLEARGQASEKLVGDFAGAEEDVVDAGVPDRE